MNLPRIKPVIGVIGAIGAGKSVVSRKFAELGALVLDADKIGHEILNQADAKAEIVREFGEDVIGNEGNVDRKRVASIVFSDRQKLRQLEKIVHSRMRTVFEEKIRESKANPQVAAVVLDAAVLLEAGWDDLCDRLLFVNAPDSQRLQRVKIGRGWDQTELARREAMQISNEEKKTRADRIIENDAAVADCERKAEHVFREWVTASHP